MPEYCNITTDLYDTFPHVEDYQEKKQLENWYATSGQSKKLLLQQLKLRQAHSGMMLMLIKYMFKLKDRMI